MASSKKNYTLSIKEASELAEVASRTLYNWIRQGKISHTRIKIGGREFIRLNEEEIRSFSQKRGHPTNESSMITLPREEYNQLIFRLGVLEAEHQRRLELEEQVQSLIARGWWVRVKRWWKGR